MAEEKIVRKIEIKTEGAEKSLEKIDKAQKDVTKSTGKLDSAMSAMPGPLSKVTAGIRTVSASFKALLANPVVLVISAIVVVLGTLTKAFSKTQAGADKIKDALSGLSAVMQVLTERAAQVFKAIGQIFKGNFKEGFNEMRGAVKGVGDEMNQAAKDAIALTQAYRALYEDETEVIKSNSVRRQQIAELVFLTRDFTKSIEERREAIIKADAIEKQILEDNIKLQEQRVKNAEQEIKNTPLLQRTREQTRKLAEEEAKLIDLQTNSLAKQRELKNRLNELDSKAAADRAKLAKEEEDRQKVIAEEEAKRLEEEKAKQEEADAIEKERLQKIADEEKARVDSLENYKTTKRAESHEGRLENLRILFENELILEEEYKLRLVDLETQHQAEIKAERDKALAEELKRKAEQEKADAELKQKELDNEQLLQSVKENIYQDSLTALTGFLGEGSKAAKAVAIADATRSAIQGAINAFTGTIKLPAPIGPILAPIAAASALAAGMANVKKIASTPDPALPGGGGGGAVSVPSVSLARSENVPVEDIVQTDVGIGQDVNIIQDRTTRGATKAYVVESEITASQDMARQKEEEISL
jgi:hypothetical protein